MTNEKKRDSSYQYILDHYKEIGVDPIKKLEDRFIFLFEAANVYIECLDLKEYLWVSRKLIGDIVEDYFADIIRLKQFHDIPLVNDIKIAAFSAYWINRRKPLVFKKDPDNSIVEKEPKIKDINEWFALSVMISMIYDQSKHLQIGLDVRTKYIDFLDLLHYNLTYRIITPQSLELALIALEGTAHSPRLNDTGQYD